jgi:glycerophosphoryl diester phosphodiesterase
MIGDTGGCGRTLIWAHRGASGQAPENTLPAFDLASRLKADGIELDVQMTCDGHLVVAHDTDCQRVAGEKGQIGQMSLQTLRTLNFARLWPAFGFVTLPTLAEVFDLIRPTGLTINIEMKNDETPYAGLEEAVLRQVIEWRMQERVLISSFSQPSLAMAVQLIRDLRLAIPCGFLYDSPLDNPWEIARQSGFSAMHPRHGLISRSSEIQAAHSAGVLVHAWTVDRADRLEQLMRMGVDAVITNKPDLAWRVRRIQP